MKVRNSDKLLLTLCFSVFLSHRSSFAADITPNNLEAQLKGHFSHSPLRPISIACAGVMLGGFRTKLHSTEVVSVHDLQQRFSEISDLDENDAVIDFKIRRVHRFRKVRWIEYGMPYWVFEDHLGEVVFNNGTIQPEKSVYPLRKIRRTLRFMGQSARPPLRHLTKRTSSKDRHFLRDSSHWNNDFLSFLGRSFGDFFSEIVLDSEHKVFLVKFRKNVINMPDAVLQELISANVWTHYDPVSREWLRVVFDIESFITESVELASK